MVAPNNFPPLRIELMNAAIIPTTVIPEILQIGNFFNEAGKGSAMGPG